MFTPEHAGQVESTKANELGEWKVRWKPALSKLGMQIGKHPSVALGIAIACGITLGWMVKRK